jgi:hypothetical protein
VQVLSFNISAIAPVLFIIGLVTFRAGGGSLAKALGRVAIGLGPDALGLHILLDIKVDGVGIDRDWPRGVTRQGGNEFGVRLPDWVCGWFCARAYAA